MILPKGVDVIAQLGPTSTRPVESRRVSASPDLAIRGAIHRHRICGLTFSPVTCTDLAFFSKPLKSVATEKDAESLNAFHPMTCVI
jgi:hypothetical protein